ncbi:MAG TPA: hypothetical protein VMZ73_06255 [Acidimicrobiales bacterium]|nr:hypothetical protein [Acidimicrobiales bacterium]
MLLPEDPALDAADQAPAGRKGVLQGMGWAGLDQAVSSCTNFGITVVAARELSRTGFGTFGLAFSISIVVMGFLRALVTEPLLSRPEAAAGERRRPAFAAVTGASLVFGGVAAAGVAIAGLFLEPDIGRALLTLAVLLPGVCVQDAWRYCFISQGRPLAAVVNDSVWLLAQVAALAVLAATGRWSPSSILLAWGGAGAGGTLLGLYQAKVLPRPQAAWSWLRDQRDLAGRYSLEFVTSNGATQLVLVGLGAISGLAALGAVRGAQTFFGPISVLFSSVVLAVVPAATRLRAAPARLRRLAGAVSAGVCAIAVAWTIAGVALPGSAGRELFGASWDSTRRVLLPMGLIFIANGVAGGPYAGLRSLAAAREGLYVRLLSLPLVIAGSLAGAAVAGATGFTYGLAGATIVTAPIYWWQFTRASTRFVESRP